MILEISESEIQEFNSLSRHLTQSWEWGSFRLQTHGISDVVRIGNFSGPKLLGTFQIFFHKIPYLDRTICYIPKSSPPNLEELSSIKNLALSKKSVYIKLEPLEHPDKTLGALESEAILPKHSLVINLDQPLDAILSAMHEKTRYNIKVAQKAGITVVQKNDSASLESFIQLYDSTQARQNFTAKSGNYLRTLWKVLSPLNMVFLLCAYTPNASTPLASIILIKFNEVLYFPYGGWSSEHREMMPNNLLHFEAIKLGQKLGCKKYDMWGSYRDKPQSSDPWYGVYVFKKGFGGEEVNYPGAFDLPLDPLMYRLINLAEPFKVPLAKFVKLFSGKK